MNSMRKWVGLLMALAFAAVALPSSAAGPTKIFSIDMSPATVTTTSASLTAKYANQTPNGNSVINTVILSPPAGVTITGASFPFGGNSVTCPATTVNSAGQTVPVPPGSICVSGIPSVMKAGCTPACSWSFNLTATLPNACSVSTWSGQAFAGNSFNGDVFTFQPAYSKVTTTIGTQCPHNITATSSGPAGSGSIAPPGVTSVAWDGSQTYTITANTGYYIANVKVDGTALPGAPTSYTFSTVEADHTIAATFAANALSVTSAPTSAVAGTQFSVTIGSTPAGATVSFSAGCDASTAPPTSDGASTTFLITINTLPSTGTCTMTFSAPNYLPTSLTNFKVYKGVLDCGDYDSVNGPGDPTYDPDLFSTTLNLGYSYVGTPGWGLRRGPNRDGSACTAKVNYTCDLNPDTNIASCTYDKASGQLATFKYLFLWGPRPPANGWTEYRPQVSWNVANPSVTPSLPDWVPLLACISDMFPTTGLPTQILPVIPSVPPFTDGANVNAWYQPNVQALVCGAQQGWTSVGISPYTSPSLQFWNIIIDEADLKVSGP
jgi:hypothetical protein